MNSTRYEHINLQLRRIDQLVAPGKLKNRFGLQAVNMCWRNAYH